MHKRAKVIGANFSDYHVFIITTPATMYTGTPYQAHHTIYDPPAQSLKSFYIEENQKYFSILKCQ